MDRESGPDGDAAGRGGEGTPRGEPRCILCGLPVGKALLGRGEPPRYCCSGCEHVHEILRSVPEEQGARIMAQARRLGIIPRAAAVDAPAAPAPAVDPGALRTERFLLEGLSCPSCAWLVAILLERSPGVARAEVDFMSDSASVTYDMGRVAPGELARVVAEAGYAMRPLGDERSPERARFSRSLARFLLALFLAGNVMMLSAVHWASYLAWIPAIDLELVAAFQLVLTVPLAAIGIGPLARRSAKLLRIGRPSMDLLFVLGFAAAFALSISAFFVEGGQFYFDACAAFAAISLLGRLIEERLRFRAVRELHALLGLAATKVAVVAAGGASVYRSLEQVQPGDRIRIPAGHPLPFDCTCEGGTVTVGEAMLTGEPTPVVKRPGETIWAGSTAEGGPVEGAVLRSYREGRLQRIAASMAEAMGRNELRLRSADRLASWFVPAVLAVAALTLAVRAAWLPGSGALSQEAWLPAIAVLLVACPCGFGIALASALAVSVSCLLRKGVLVKDGAALERFPRIDRLALDKTGTLTDGRWRIQALRWLGEPEPALLEAVAGAERGSEHPVARALVQHLVRERELEPRPPGEVEEHPGRGIRARFGDRVLSVGSGALFDGAPGAGSLEDRTTVVYFGWEGRAAGCFLLQDAMRPESGEVVRSFARQGIESIILSGDRSAVVKAVGRALGVQDARGELTPEEKREAIVALGRLGHRVAFTGDGANDGPAMAEAEVGIALRHGTDLSLAAASIVPLSGELASLPRVLQVARRTRRTIRQNYGWALIYNLVFLPVAAAGLLHPIFAAALMFLSSTTVLLHSLRLRSWIDRAWAGEVGTAPS